MIDLKKIWTDWINSIKESDNAQFRKTIGGLKKQIKELKAKDLERIKDLNEYDLKVKSLEEQLKTPTIKPEVKKPSWLKGSASYRARRRVVAKDYDELVTLPKLEYAFDKSPYMKDILTEKDMIGKKTFTDVNRYYKHFITQWKYAYDKVDNWRPVMDTLLSKQIDCEDGAIALASGLGIIGFAEDEVGVCLGWYYPKGKSVDKNTKFYHAWCTVKINNKWYILESTNPRASMRLWSKDKWADTYQAEMFFNWKFDGNLTTTHL